jgi:plastocyanin
MVGWRTGVAVMAVPGVAMALLVAGCGSDSSSGSADTPATTAATTAASPYGSPSGTQTTARTTIAGLTANDHGTKDVTGSDEVDMELDDYYFGPTVLTGRPGQKVTIKLENEGSEEHNFSIDAQKVDQDVESGEDATVTVTFPTSGTVSFYCTYHKALGMAGGLTTK